VTRGGSLHDRADDGEDSSEDQVIAATNLVGDDARAKSADKTTALQSGDNVGLQISFCNFFQALKTVSPNDRVSSLQGPEQALWKILLLEGLHGQDTADDTGVHTEQHTTEASLSLSACIRVTMSRNRNPPSLPRRTRAIRRSLGDPA
jgi:hypothetical protein